MIRKLTSLPLFPIILICIIAGMGIIMLNSAANNSMEPWGNKQLIRFAVGFILMIIVACTKVRTLLAMAYPIYAIALFFLIAVEVMGFVGMGAQRWINLGVFNLQPSEIMRIGLILTLARYFHEVNQENINNPGQLIFPLLLILMPVLLVLRQPDLGTAMLMLLSSAALIYMAGVSIWYFIGSGVAILSAIPILWGFLHEYQKKRVMIFLNPESDPIHSGYHIIQSKIALGSGGMWGKGYLFGTQSHLNFLPEKQTDFIFTMFCEEFGMFGALILILLYVTLIIYNIRIALNSNGVFSKLTAMTLAITFFLYVFINMAMVMGLLPVVGIPLPLFSYGGTAMLTLLISQGILFAIHTKDSSRQYMY